VPFTSPAQSRHEDKPGATANGPQTGFCATSKRRDEVAQEMCECLIDIVAALFSVSGKELRRPGRTGESVSRVRQIAMYVAHVVLRLTQGEVGRGFGRDRTTVIHACHTIEDLRDDAEFDRVVSMVEHIAQAAFRARKDA
jgi:chromosomal replication initiation ATPase DnaA